MATEKPASEQPLKHVNIDVLAHEFKAYTALQGKTQREIVIAFIRRCI